MELSVSRLRAVTRRELMRVDAAAADLRRRDAERAANVTIHAAADGMAELRVFCPAPLAAPIYETIDRYARMARDDGEPGSLGQLRVGVFADLTLRPWDTSRPPMTAHVEVVAPLPSLGDATAPGEVNGHPITAGQLRGLLQEIDSLCPGGLQPPTGGTVDVAIVDDVTGALRATVTRPELERLVRRGCPDHAIACNCPVRAHRSAVDRYRPSAAQGRFTRSRDRTCRHPGCRNKAAWADLDHVMPYGCGGPTDCANLCCLCRRHHRLKTHAPGWRFELRRDGTLAVTTPSGVTRVTRPPGLTLHDPVPEAGFAATAEGRSTALLTLLSGSSAEAELVAVRIPVGRLPLDAAATPPRRCPRIEVVDDNRVHGVTRVLGPHLDEPLSDARSQHAVGPEQRRAPAPFGGPATRAWPRASNWRSPPASRRRPAARRRAGAARRRRRRGEQRPPRPARERREVQRSHELVLGATRRHAAARRRECAAAAVPGLLRPPGFPRRPAAARRRRAPWRAARVPDRAVRQNAVARCNHWLAATTGSKRATRQAAAATTAVICSDDSVPSAEAQNGAHAAGSGTGSANGNPPSGSVTELSQSQSSAERGEVTGARSANASKACSAPPGWLVRDRRSGSSPQP